MWDRDGHEEMGPWQCEGKSSLEFLLVSRECEGDFVLVEDVLSHEQIVLAGVWLEGAGQAVRSEMRISQLSQLSQLSQSHNPVAGLWLSVSELMQSQFHTILLLKHNFSLHSPRAPHFQTVSQCHSCHRTRVEEMSSPNNLNSITINSRHLLITSLLSIKSSAFLMFSFNVLSISWVLKDLRLIITRASATYYHHSWVGLLLKRNVMQFEFWALALATGHITGAGAGGQQSASTWELRATWSDQIRAGITEDIKCTVLWPRNVSKLMNNSNHLSGL